MCLEISGAIRGASAKACMYIYTSNVPALDRSRKDREKDA